MSNFDLQTLFKGEIKRWLWLMAAVFAAITLYQYTSLNFSPPPKTTNLTNTSHHHQQFPHNNSASNNFSTIPTSNNDTSFAPVLDIVNLTKSLQEIIFPPAPAPAPEPIGMMDGGDYRDEGDVDVISPASGPDSSENEFNRRKHSLGNTNTSTNSTSSSTSSESPPEPAATDITPISKPINNTPPPPLSSTHADTNTTSPSPLPLSPLQEKSIPVAPPVTVNQPPPPQLLLPLPQEISIPVAAVNQPPPSPPPPQKKTTPAGVNQQPPLQFDKDVYSLRDMDEMLAQGQRTSRSMVPLWPSIADQQLVRAKSEIQNARPPPVGAGLYAPLYRNLTQFYRSYELMEKTLKVYVYKEGDRPVFHRPNLQGIYASEGWFMKHMESSKKFLTNDPRKAHLFYLPFSSQLLVTTLYVPNSHRRGNLIQYLKDYVDGIVAKYPYWNRTGGADHFLISCHDWAPDETRQIMSTCIRALCNADVKVGSFQFGKDISLPETNVHTPKTPLKSLGGKPPSKRKTLAFFAGQIAHGYLRPILIKHWENRDPDNIKIFGKLPKTKGNRNYISYMQDSKYCICPRGYEVNSPRVVEAIFHECVPVIISDNFVPPMFETLDWESFAVFVAEKDVPRLKEILVGISEKRYLRLYMRVRMVQRHFLWNVRPVKYDLFHMILHSVWVNRVNQFRSE